jgi:hypothetical protein
VKVWIVLRIDYSETHIEGVWSTPKAAEAQRAEGERRWRGYGWTVEEYAVDEVPIGATT